MGRTMEMMLAIGAVSAFVAVGLDAGGATNRITHEVSSDQPALRDVNVNFGGWLCLEDWFFSGDAGRSVSTGIDTPQGQGACLPPKGSQLPEYWPSEGILVKRLNDTHGPAETAETFMAHRRSFIGTADLEKIKSLGIKKVRVPITWAVFADALAPISPATYGKHDPEKDAAVVPDPFYIDTVAFVTVPRSWLRQFLNKAGSYGIKVVFDIHNFPGGSSDGTYNGIWPSPPKFWLEKVAIGNRSVTLKEAGLMVTHGLIQWLESLEPSELQHVAGVTLMNEPAHLSAGKDWASEGEVLAWLTEAFDQFRKSSLHSHGLRLYANIIETAFKDFMGTVAPWWHATFTEAEQKEWAVMDRHWYSAWGGESCSGRTVAGGGYFCDQPLDDVRKILRGCLTPWADDFATNFTGLRAITEFSVGTFDQALFACIDHSTLQLFLNEQAATFKKHEVEAFFWTWHMPYGSSFEPGWSFKHLMGMEKPKQPLPCYPPLSDSIRVEV